MGINTTDRNKLSAILSGMVEGVIAIDRDERVVHMNEAAGKLLGTSPVDSLNKPVREAVRIRDVCEILNLTLQDEVSRQRDLRLVTSPSDQQVEMHASP